jgi:hypothetical protein
VVEQPVVGALAQHHVEQDVGVGLLQPFAERLDVVGDDSRGALGTEGQSDVGGGDDLGGQPGQGLTDLLAEHRAAGLAQDADERPGHRLGLLGDGLAHRADDVLGDRQHERLPGGRGRLDPLGAAPGHGRRGSGRDVGDPVEPGLGQAHGVIDRSGLTGVR